MESWEGYCSICAASVRFEAHGPWYRDQLFCGGCGSIPRERALMLTVRRLYPMWAEATIHESSPTERGVSTLLKAECANYVPTQFFRDITPGEFKNSVRCENLERQTFADNTFHLVITQDVMEHVFNPDAAYSEIYRTLKPGGIHIHTTPIYKELAKTERCAEQTPDGTIRHLRDPEYHGNPIGSSGSLLTFRYGRDLADLISEWTPFAVEVHSFKDRHLGLIAEFLDVIVCRK
jgi:SAM-dependent methyltransferase